MGVPLKLNAKNYISFQNCEISAKLIFKEKLKALNNQIVTKKG